MLCFSSDYLEITGETTLGGRWTRWVPAGTDVLVLLGFAGFRSEGLVRSPELPREPEL